MLEGEDHGESDDPESADGHAHRIVRASRAVEDAHERVERGHEGQDRNGVADVDEGVRYHRAGRILDKEVEDRHAIEIEIDAAHHAERDGEHERTTKGVFGAFFLPGAEVLSDDARKSPRRNPSTAS